ncbi:hypothetical protein ACQI4L_09130 [Mycolicibacterium litorale]|uniref:hypothetical protein n=1 Tax=Mycolicibacterium litorale TaxID=758802 RepID=UPI003CED5BFF
MNRAARRAARYTKAGRRAHAQATEHICEHGNYKKTDGNGNPMCPHGCGFEKREQRGATARVFDAEWNELDNGPLNEVADRLTGRAPST